MDNLTHSLVGALLGQMGLKRKTGLAMPTLIIAANIPDIDVVAVLLGGHQHLALRRGITHGPIAMVVLPLLLWGAMILYDNWRTRRGRRPENRLPIDKIWLLALAFVGCLSHPLFDWFNSYGVRLLEPFSSQWFYGDTLFIIDVWIWAMGIAGLLFSYRKERQGYAHSHRPAVIAVLMILSYTAINLAISRAGVISTAGAIQDGGRGDQIDQIVANPLPVAFWRREMLFGSRNNYYRTEYSVFDTRPVRIDTQPLEIQKDLVHIVDIEKLARTRPELAAFLFWSRMPYDGIMEMRGKRIAVVRDARFSNPMIAGRFTVEIPLKGNEGAIDPAALATCTPCLDE
jgi:inner membrane protein